MEIKKCFIVTPIGNDNSEIRRSAEGLIDALIEPILTEMGYKIYVAHRMNDAGSITQQLLKHVLEDELVIVNLTGLNPNVMYELAVRHAARKPLIQLCEIGTNLPFDITDQRTIFYRNDMMGIVEIKEKLKNMIQDAIKDVNPDNPIYRAIESNMILKQVETEDAQTYIIHKLEQLESKITKLDNGNNTSVRKKENDRKITVEVKGEYTEEIIRNFVDDLFSAFEPEGVSESLEGPSNTILFHLYKPQQLNIATLKDICVSHGMQLKSVK